MHIPSANTTEIEVLKFADALRSAETPSEEYDIGKWIYAPNFYSEYRYILGTRGENPLICVGINPSTAKPDDLDNTLKSVQRIAQGNGFDSFLMFNVYAQRATRPDDMEKTCNWALHEENMEAFRYLLSIGRAPTTARLVFVCVVEDAILWNNFNNRECFAGNDTTGKFASFDKWFDNNFLFTIHAK